jgi:hypothetical protein
MFLISIEDWSLFMEGGGEFFVPTFLKLKAHPKRAEI